MLGGGGANRDRTDDLLNAIQALSQLSYGPVPAPYSGMRQPAQAPQERVILKIDAPPGSEILAMASVTGAPARVIREAYRLPSALARLPSH